MPGITAAICLLVFPLVLPRPQRGTLRSIARRIAVTAFSALFFEIVFLASWSCLTLTGIYLKEPQYERLPESSMTSLQVVGSELFFEAVYSETQQNLTRLHNWLNRFGGFFGLVDCGWLTLATNPQPPPGQDIAYVSVRVPIWLLLLLCAAYPAHRAISVIRFSSRRRRGLCLHCGYDLTGLTEARCPECGTGFTLPNAAETDRGTCESPGV